MKVGRVIAVSVLLLGLACWQGFGASGDSGKPAGAKESPTTQPDGAIKLTYEANEQVAGVFTPRKLVDKVGFQFFDGKGSLDICGKGVALVGMTAGRRTGFGLDADGNGTVDQKEIQVVAPNKPLLFRLKQEGKKEFAVVVDRLQVAALQGGKVRVSGDYYAACGLKGNVGANKTVIRIIDDNMDGKITQDGNDAIAVGTSVCAQPLYKIHQIGGSFYELSVAEDMSGVTCTKLDELKAVKVSSPLLKKGVLRALVVVNETDGQAFDLVACKSNIPTGEYALAYGALEAGKDVVIIKPGRNTKKITVGENGGDIGLGPPMKLLFSAFLLADKVTVRPEVMIVGAGGEIYQPDFGSTSGRPVVTLSEGNKIISRKAMEFG